MIFLFNSLLSESLRKRVFSMDNNGGSGLKVENWNGHEIRFVYNNGEWWAVAKDVAEALGYRGSNDMTKRMDKTEISSFDWKKKQTEDYAGCFKDYKYKAKVPVLSEFGIYEAILNSRKPEAKEFKKWVKQLLKNLREKSGLEGFQVFLMMDKEHQKQMMAKVNELPEADKKDFIKANTIANKTVSDLYGFEKMIKKTDMTPEMLKDRQPILEDTVKLMRMKNEYDLDISVSKSVKNKWLKNN